ncbi:MAG: hypothetical protein J7M14_06285 [Planctomycetes bacterium]|nr:hypothetical protein [Planctomycetota bacterium]
MTIRAVVIGLLVSIGLATAGYVNDTWLFLSYIGGDLIPIHAFGLLLLGLLVIGPLLRLIKRWEIKPAEWVVMFSLSLMGSFIAGSGLLWTFPHPVIAPIVEYPTNAGWRRNKVLDYAPDIMMVDAKPVDAKPGSQLYKTKLAHEKVVEDFCRGKRTSAGNIAWSDVPWAAWNKTLGFWFTVLSLCFIGFVCMMVVVHRQWSTRENLSYPIALFTNELITHDGKGLLNPLFRSRAFWMGFGVAGVLLLINGYAKWNTEFISVPISVDFSPFLDKFERFRKMPIMMNLFKVNFYFAVMGLAFFLSSDVSFSLGISGWLYAGVMAPLFLAGVNMEGTAFTGGLWPFLYFGAYLGMAIMVFYLGRRFYVAVLKRIFFIPMRNSEGGDKTGGVTGAETTAGRIMVVTSLVLVVLLWQSAGLHLLLSILFVLLTGMLFLMVARINASSGLFVIQPGWHPVGILLGGFGGLAIGPHAIVILAMLCAVVTLDPRIAVAPLAANAFRLGDLQKVRTSRLAGWMTVAVIVSMLVAVPVTVYLLYNVGHDGMLSKGTKWAANVSKEPFKMLSKHITDLKLGGSLAEASKPTSLGRLMKPVTGAYFGEAIGAGVVLVMLCSYMRLRFPWWPLHPIVFLIWGTSYTVQYAPSFLLAWLLKGSIMRFGGTKAYRTARTFFIGLAAGEFAVSMFWAIVGVIYYLATGTPGTSVIFRE